jgi:hypothetical protein
LLDPKAPLLTNSLTSSKRGSGTNYIKTQEFSEVKIALGVPKTRIIEAIIFFFSFQFSASLYNEEL